MTSDCPICGVTSQYKENKIGIHCEGLVCEFCGGNARNRFFYLALNNIINELQRGDDIILKVVESSGFGYSSLSKLYIESRKFQNIEIICGDFYQNNFKAQQKLDLTNMAFGDDTLDIICHSHVLEHIENDELALKEAYRCLKPGGTLLFSVPIQTDFTFSPIDEYHGDDAYVYRRNGWDIIKKIKDAGFRVSVLAPPEHDAFSRNTPSFDPSDPILDNIMYAEKYSHYYSKYRELFYPACRLEYSTAQLFDKIWGQLEVFVAHKPFL